MFASFRLAGKSHASACNLPTESSAGCGAARRPGADDFKHKAWDGCGSNRVRLSAGKIAAPAAVEANRTIRDLTSPFEQGACSAGGAAGRSIQPV
jgi:hypothetical protein